MPNYDDFLVEIHTEELPPKALLRLAKSFLQEITTRLTKAELSFGDARFFATPRRLAIFVKKLMAQQADNIVERKGPAVTAAYDNAGRPTQACIGFARSCQVEPAQLIKIKSLQGEWVGYKQKISGKHVSELLPAIVQQALTALPIPKRMRWGNQSDEFVRPVHSVIMLYGKKVIPAKILGCYADRKTQGHRFHSKGWITISHPAHYEKTLEKKFVIVDFEQRKEKIRQQAQKLIQKSLGKRASVSLQPELLDEVTGLVEWPVALMGDFDKKFLHVPQEVLISAMQDHQRYFPILDRKNKLLPHFVTISNIKSKKATRVILGNERVLHARLSDAAFFFETDKEQKLADRIELLKNIIFQNKLGSLYEKAQRLSHLTAFIEKESFLSEHLSDSADDHQEGTLAHAKRAGLLAKTDLTTQLVGEFPELQGVAGYYYAQYEGESKAVAKALNEQYLPRFANDFLPETSLGCALAIADRIDLLVGVFGIHQAPTGDKDPFGLRRAALGVLRILIEKKINLDLRKLLEFSAQCYENKLGNPPVIDNVFNFTIERLKYWYQEQGMSADVFAAVTATGTTRPYDMHCRILAVTAFKNLPEAEALSIANKRVTHILEKYNNKIIASDIDTKLFEHDAERMLALKLAEQRDAVALLSRAAEYTPILTQLAHLREPVDAFFEHVLVMTDDKPRRENRLLLLKELRKLFLQVADIALLQ